VTAITRLIGVYDADGSVAGELSYFLRKRVGRAHCALCDITHGRVRERNDWKSSRARLPVPFVTFHRDDQPDDVRAAGTPPVVLAQTADDELVVLLNSDDLERCAGSTDLLVERIESVMAARRFSWAASAD
jgi:hypothetical protein